MPQIIKNKVPYVGNIYDTQPVGEVVQIGSDTAPVGYLPCDGRSLLRSEYPELFKRIGTTYGAEDDEHFNLPKESDVDIVSTEEINSKLNDYPNKTESANALTELKNNIINSHDIVLNADDAIVAGIYGCIGNTTGLPPNDSYNYGILKVWGQRTDVPNIGAQWIYQEFITTGGVYYSRQSINSNSTTPRNWTEWVQTGTKIDNQFNKISFTQDPNVIINDYYESPTSVIRFSMWKGTEQVGLYKLDFINGGWQQRVIWEMNPCDLDIYSLVSIANPNIAQINEVQFKKSGHTIFLQCTFTCTNAIGGYEDLFNLHESLMPFTNVLNFALYGYDNKCYLCYLSKSERKLRSRNTLPANVQLVMDFSYNI